jgi:hypothetical protein
LTAGADSDTLADVVVGAPTIFDQQRKSLTIRVPCTRLAQITSVSASTAAGARGLLA